MDSPVYIYGITDPRNREVRYVGKANNPSQRLKGHMRFSPKGKTPLYSWMRKLQKEGIKPEMIILEVCQQSDWEQVERKHIAQHRNLGTRLLNLADGGNAPFCSKEIRQKNGRNTAQAINNNPIQKRIWMIKRLMGKAIKDGTITESQRQKLRAAAQLNPQLFGLWANA